MKFKVENALEFHQMVLSKKTVESLSARDKKRLLMLTNMMRDMDLFRKLLVYIRLQKTGQKQLDEAAFVTLAFSFLKILISKVFEVWEFLNSEKIKDDRSGFSDELAGLWDDVELFFLQRKNRELFCFVRNKFGFHFDHYVDLEPYIEKAMNEIGDLEFWLGNDSSGNDIYSSSNTVMLTVLCKKMAELGFIGSDEDLVGQLQRLPVDISNKVNQFCKRYFIEIILKEKSFTQKTAVIIAAPLLSEVNLPLITRNDLFRK